MSATVVGTMIATFLVMSTAGAVAIFVYIRTQPRIVEPKKAPSGPESPYLQEQAAKVAALETVVKGLPSLWEEERERARQHADRAATAYRSAEKLLAAVDDADEGEDEGHPLYDDDEEAGPSEGVLPLQPGLGLSASGDEQDLRERAAAAIQTLAGMGR